MAEAGVYQGGSAKVIAQANPDKLLHLFDTFEGIPADDTHGAHKQGDFAAKLSDVVAYLEPHAQQLRYHAGIFPYTARPVAHLRFCFAHLDLDTYQSTRAGVLFFWDRLVTGGVLVLDDWDWCACPGVRKAVEELLPGVTVNEELNQAWITKP